MEGGGRSLDLTGRPLPGQKGENELSSQCESRIPKRRVQRVTLSSSGENAPPWSSSLFSPSKNSQVWKRGNHDVSGSLTNRTSNQQLETTDRAWLELHINCSDRVWFFRTFTLQTNASSSHDGGPQLMLLDCQFSIRLFTLKELYRSLVFLCLCRKFVWRLVWRILILTFLHFPVTHAVSIGLSTYSRMHFFHSPTQMTPSQHIAISPVTSDSRLLQQYSLPPIFLQEGLFSLGVAKLQKHLSVPHPFPSPFVFFVLFSPISASSHLPC